MMLFKVILSESIRTVVGEEARGRLGLGEPDEAGTSGVVGGTFHNIATFHTTIPT